MLYFFLDRGQTNSLDNNLVVFAEPGELSLETNLETFYADAVVKGSKNNDLYLNFKKINSNESISINSLSTGTKLLISQFLPLYKFKTKDDNF